MNKFNKSFQRIMASLMILMMIITLIPLNVLAEGEDKGVNVWIRIEGNDKSLVELRELNVEASDISYVEGLKDLEINKPLLIHAIVKALEDAGIDVKDPEVFSVAGGYIGGIGDYRSESGGWMYLINDDMSSSGVKEYELNENDIIDMFYVVDWTNYYTGKLESTSKTINLGEELILNFTAKKEEWGADHKYEPVEGGIVKVKGEEKKYTTDENGQVKITFDKVGTYTILADKQLEEGNIVRPRPLTIEVKEKLEEKEEEKVELDIDKSIANAANWLIKNDEVNEWVVMELARANKEIPESNLIEFKNEIENNNGEFRLVTDYAKYSILASSLGLDATDLFGYNLIEKIYNHENVFTQGNNGGVFALLALDSKNYDVPKEANWTRENIIKELLETQKEDGGFPWIKDWDSDVDMTAMTLQALSNYKDREDVKPVIEKALNYLSNNQDKNGGYKNKWDGVVSESSESVAQVILALTSLNIDPVKDERFVKDANLVEKLLTFQLEDGSFEHNIGDGSNAYATEQALRGLVSYNRFLNEELKFFDMEDAKLIEFPEGEKPDISFSDIDKASHWAKESILKAAELGLMEGKGNNIFAPQEKVTRAEFAKMLTNLFELETFDDGKEVFTDVKANAWYYDAVMKAYKAGIITGKGNHRFAPEDSITREEMAVMIYRALGINNVVEKQEIKDIDKASHWAMDSINLVYELGIMKGDNNYFNPNGKVTREMAATIVVRVYELD